MHVQKLVWTSVDDYNWCTLIFEMYSQFMIKLSVQCRQRP